MVREGIADFAITEDSDLIAYGCPRILTKLNLFGMGHCWSIQDFKSFTSHVEKGEKEDKTIKIL